MPSTAIQRVPRGMTLIELLVVVTIIIIVFAVLVPKVRPAIDDLKLREAARQAATAFADAQAIAVLQKRPAGVRLMGINGAGVLELVGLETPPPYAGDTLNAYCMVSAPSGNSANGTFSGASMIPTLGIGQGDTIRFNYRGPFYVIQSANASNVTFTYTGTSPLVAGNYPFQIFRKPIRSISRTMQLPRGVCIDLFFSGEGVGGSWSSLVSTSGSISFPIIDIMFAPDGRPFYYVTNSSGVTQSVTPQGSLYFLVGRIDNLGTQTQLDDFSNRWISVRTISGQCIPFENLGGQGGGNLTYARSFGTTGQGMGGQ